MNRGTARYPLLEIDLDKLKANLAALIERCQSLSVEVAGVVKGFSALPEAAGVYTECGVRSLASSRLSQLRALRGAGVACERVLIRIPMLSELPEVAEVADMSLQSELETLRALNAVCAKRGTRHRVILMADLGDLREGFWSREELVDAALEVDGQLEAVEVGLVAHIGDLADLACLVMGKNRKSRLCQNIAFSSYNDRFKDEKDFLSWLSKNAANRMMYRNDSWCGGISTVSFFRDVAAGLAKVHKAKNIRKIPLELPVLAVYGSDDPVGDYGKSIEKLLEAYRKNGVKNVSSKIYDGDRHEILNEENSDEILSDIFNWIEKNVSL